MRELEVLIFPQKKKYFYVQMRLLFFLSVCFLCSLSLSGLALHVFRRWRSRRDAFFRAWARRVFERGAAAARFLPKAGAGGMSFPGDGRVSLPSAG